MHSLLASPYLWSALALVSLALLCVKFARAPVLGWLDGEIAKIRSELEQAKALRKEAEALLVSYKAREQEALQEAAAMVAQAEREAGYLREAAARELQESLAHYAEQAAERIAHAEAEAVADVRRAVIDLAEQASTQVLREQLNAAQASDYLDRVIAELPGQLAKKTAA